MKKMIFVLALLIASFTMDACSGAAKCDPACPEGKVCFEHDGKYECALKCEKDEDCTKDKTGKDGLVCHKEHGTSHCGEKE